MVMEKEKLVLLVTAAQKGDNKATNELFNAFYNDFYYFALKTVKDEETALDITQEAFVEIINTLGNLKEPAAFVTWAKQITYHQCTRYFRKKQDVLVDENEDGSTVFDTIKEESAEFIPDEALDSDDFKKTILAILDELSEEQRSATLMYYFDEMSVREIAEIQGVPEGTVKSRLNYARKTIKQSVEDYEKKNNIKLHAIPFFPFFKWIFEGAFEEGLSAAAASTVAEGITTATGVAVSAGTGVAATTAAATSIASGTTTAVATATTAVKIASIPLITKVIAGIVAAAIVIGGGVAAFVGISGKDDGKAQSDDRPASNVTSSNQSSTDGTIDDSHTCEWGDWNKTEKSFGPITIERNAYKQCKICGEKQNADRWDGMWNIEKYIFGDDYYIFLDRYFDVAGYSEDEFSTEGLFAAGDFLASEEHYSATQEPTVEISADEYFKKLEKYFTLSDDIIAKMKQERPGDTYTVAFGYNGANLMPTSYVWEGGNIYSVYFSYGHSGCTHIPVFKGKIEYNGHEGKPNKIISLKSLDNCDYDMSRVTDNAVSLETLVENVVTEAEELPDYYVETCAATPDEIKKVYNVFKAMDVFGYNLTETEMYGKEMGYIELEAEGDTLKSITATLELPILSWDVEPSEITLAAARRDIEKFVTLVGDSDNIYASINGAEGVKGTDCITDEIICEIATAWANNRSICLYTKEPLVVNGRKCTVSYTLSAPQGFHRDAYYILFSINFCD